MSKFKLQKEVLKLQRRALINLSGFFGSYTKNGVYYNEANRYKIKTKVKAVQEDGTIVEVEKRPVPRTGILLYFMINLYPIDKRGFIKNVNTKEIAEKLDVSHNAIMYNIERLTENELVYASKVGPYTYNFYIVGYEKTFLPKNKGGSGYVVITKEMLEKLLEIKDVNSLRIEIRKILQHSRDFNVGREKYLFTCTNKPSSVEGLELYPYNPNINYSDIPYSKYKVEELGYFLPKYLRYPKKIKKLSNNSKIFTNKEEGNNIYFKYNVITPEEILIMQTFNYTQYFEKRLKKVYPQIKNKEREDIAYTLGVLSLHEYGFKNVKKALEDIAFNYEKPITNLVGFIKTYLQEPKEFSLISKEKVIELEKNIA